jgi:hypothetical protein
MIKGAPKRAEAKSKSKQQTQEEELKKAVPRGAMMTSRNKGDASSSSSGKKMSTPATFTMPAAGAGDKHLNLRLRQQSMDKDAILADKAEVKPIRTRVLASLLSVLDRFETVLFLSVLKMDGNTTTSSTGEPETPLLPFSFMFSTFAFYPLASLIGFICIVCLRVKQMRSRFYQELRPEVANVKDLAIQKIQQATNGGWIVSHLRDAVGSAMEFDPEGAPYDHLMRRIWPLVVVELQNDDRLEHSVVVSCTTGQSQEVVAWKSEEAPNGHTQKGRSERSKRSTRRRVTIQDRWADSG